MRLRNRVAVVTGGGRGIGKASALALAREGAAVVLASRTQPELEEVAGEIRQTGAEALTVPTDVRDPDQVEHLMESARRSWGKIDVLVNAAGVYGPIGPVWEVNLQEWKNAIDINLIGTLHCIRSVLGEMIAQREGRIINFSGGGATSPLPRFSAYGVTKAAVVRLTEVVADEVKDFDILVNVIAPGAVDTRLQDDVLKAEQRAGDLYERIKRLREKGEGGVPAELPASLVVFLASEVSKGLTGKLIAAPHDGWQDWDEQKISGLAGSPWFTLRRIDPYTLRPLIDELSKLEE